jgi:hypothetical protein
VGPASAPSRAPWYDGDGAPKPARRETRPFFVWDSGSHSFAPFTGGCVQLSIVALNFVYAALGVVLMYMSYRVIDWLTPEVDFKEELKRGNIAVAIFMAAIFVSIALIIGRALS